MKQLLFAILIGVAVSSCTVYSDPYYPEYPVRYDAYGAAHYYDPAYGIWIGPGHPHYYHYHYYHNYRGYRGGHRR